MRARIRLLHRPVRALPALRTGRQFQPRSRSQLAEQTFTWSTESFFPRTSTSSRLLAARSNGNHVMARSSFAGCTASVQDQYAIELYHGVGARAGEVVNVDDVVAGGRGDLFNDAHRP